MALKSGKYLAKTESEVVVWPSPDKDGDGEEVWENQYDVNDNVVGQVRAKDKWGNEIFSYLPPAGFANKPGYTHQDCWVKVTDRGQVVRDKNGEAIGIKPGQAIIFHADGTREYLDDEYAQYQFGLRFDPVDNGDNGNTPDDVSPVSTADLQAQRDAAQARLDELNALLAPSKE